MVIPAVEMAIWQRQGASAVILHSDRGCQFTSTDYQRFLRQNALISSMSVFTIGAIALVMRLGRTCSTTSSDSTIQECDVESPCRI